MVRRLSEPADHDFDRLAGHLDYPMFIVTAVARDDGERSGCLVGFATQCSIDPPRFLVCISNKNHTFRVAARADAIAVHVIPGDRHDLAELFGEETGDEIDKFARCDWTPGPQGVPLLDGCPARFAGEVLERVALGDHTGHLLKPVLAQGEPAPDFLRFSAVRDMPAGHDA